jgi:hypothetical protein
MHKLLLAALAALALTAAGCQSGSNEAPIPGVTAAAQLTANPTFTAWSHGSPRTGNTTSGVETADHWKAKWNKSTASRGVAYKMNGGGLRYVLTPDPAVAASVDGGETFYTRQTWPHLDAAKCHSYRMTVVAQASAPGVRAGFYINLRWNVLQRLYIVNTVSSIPMATTQATYSADFTVPCGEGVTWKTDESQGIEYAFLTTTPTPASVDILSVTLVPIPAAGA